MELVRAIYEVALFGGEGRPIAVFLAVTLTLVNLGYALAGLRAVCRRA